MLAQVINAITYLDIGFFIDLILNNLIWVFAFLLVGHMSSEGKNTLVTGIIAWFVVICTMELFQKLAGFTIYTAGILLIIYLGRLFVLGLLTSKKEWTQYLSLGYVMVFYTVVAWVLFWGV